MQFSFAQHIKIDKSILSFLSQETEVNITFTYENIVFNTDSISEKEFTTLASKKETQNHGEAAGKSWLESYYNSKEAYWPEIFTTTLNEKVATYKNNPEFVLNSKEATYTMQVHTTWMYFGYNVVVGKEPAKVQLILNFYKTNEPNNIIYTTTINRALGKNNNSYNLDQWSHFSRVGKAYKKGAYKLAQSFKRILD